MKSKYTVNNIMSYLSFTNASRDFYESLEYTLANVGKRRKTKASGQTNKRAKNRKQRQKMKRHNKRRG